MKYYLLVFCFAVLFCGIFVVTATASETRVLTMGQTGVFMYDNSNVVLFPGAMMRYGNEIVTELRLKDTESLFSAEVRLPFNSYMVGVNFNRPISFFNPGVGMNISLNQTSDIYFGTPLGGNNLGVRLSYGRDGFNQDSTLIQPMVEESARYLEIAAGYSSDKYDAAISFELPSVTSEVSGDKDEYSGTGINLNGRYFYPYDAEMVLIPVVQVRFGSATRKTDMGVGVPQRELDYSLLNFNLGIGLNYELNANSLLIFAIDPFAYGKLTTKLKGIGGGETTITTTSIPRMYLGAETSISSWLTGRIGANRAYQTVTTKLKPAQGTAEETSYQTSPYNVSFGLGLRFGKFLIDLDINDGFFFEGPNLISGQMRDFSNRVSISYLFSNQEGSQK